MAERGMGRGLAAILPPPREQAESLQQIPVELIDPNPRQPRTSFDDAELRGLAESLRLRGMLQPVLIRPLAGGRYELVAGERRLRAARLAGLQRVPAMVRSTEEGERLELALIENVAREDLNAVDAARACAALVDELGLTKEEIGRRIGKSRAAVSNVIRLLELPDDVLGMIESGELSEGHGRAILQLRDRGSQRALARRARDESLTVRRTEALARSDEPDGGAGRTRRTLVPADALAACRELEDSLGSLLGQEVRVRATSRGAKVEIAFDDLRDAQGLVASLSGLRAA